MPDLKSQIKFSWSKDSKGGWRDLDVIKEATFHFTYYAMLLRSLDLSTASLRRDNHPKKAKLKLFNFFAVCHLPLLFNQQHILIFTHLKTKDCTCRLYHNTKSIQIAVVAEMDPFLVPRCNLRGLNIN